MIVELVEAEQRDNGLIVALVDVTDDNGSIVRLSHFMPPDTMEWRAAEYDLDPIADKDLILDLVLFEPHLEIPDEERLYKTDRETAKAAIRSRIKAERGKSDAAKALRTGKPSRVGAAATEEECRAKLASMSFLHPEVVEIKREAVLRKCAAEDASRRERTPVTQADRVSQALRLQELSRKADVKAVEAQKMEDKSE